MRFHSRELGIRKNKRADPFFVEVSFELEEESFQGEEKGDDIMDSDLSNSKETKGEEIDLKLEQELETTASTQTKTRLATIGLSN